MESKVCGNERYLYINKEIVTSIKKKQTKKKKKLLPF